MDGPQMSPPDIWSPFAMEGDDEIHTYFVMGDETEPVTQKSRWGRINNETGGLDYETE